MVSDPMITNAVADPLSNPYFRPPQSELTSIRIISASDDRRCLIRRMGQFNIFDQQPISRSVRGRAPLSSDGI
jgi:hypothetical protein